ncbi:MAG TPA: hypothetical protein VMX13_12380 [Sedimentisphaerales bacterium]|nr:hypothetical protein [Sedimentisphaerales bacterium]
MDNEKQTSDALDSLSQTLLFPRIFRTFRMAIQPSKMIIAFAAILIICLAGRVMDLSRTVVTAPDGATELQVYFENPHNIQNFVETNKENSEATGVFVTLWNFNRERFHHALNSLFTFNLVGVAENISDCLRAITWAFQQHLLYCIVFFVIGLAVISVAGGAICRIAALQLAQGEKPGMTESLAFAMKRFLSFFAAPLVPLGIIAFVGAFVALLGLVGNIPRFGELMVGILMPLVLLTAALITIVLIGAVAGFSLMFPAAAYDGSDCFDAVSRSFSYVYAKPWRMGFYTSLAAIYGAICYLFVRFFAWTLLIAAYVLLDVGIISGSAGTGKLTRIWTCPTFLGLLQTSTVAPANGTEWFAALLIKLFVLAVIGLIVAFIMSFYFSASTIIYALMRKTVDNTPLEDIYKTTEETQTESSTPAESRLSHGESEAPPDNYE